MGIWGDFNVKAEQRQDMMRLMERQVLIRQALAGRRPFVQRRPDFWVRLPYEIRLALAVFLPEKFHLQAK